MPGQRKNKGASLLQTIQNLSQLLTMLFAILSGCSSLRELSSIRFVSHFTLLFLQR
ncbi:DUF4372 domain-containing protein [Solitalea agri]|uniref:DUF4372 domain-containing protein n=1 Tax=Solitalea TaxID=929509 RepID=UPI003612C0BE